MRVVRRALATALLTVSLPATAAAAPVLPLGHAGRWITDARGRVVVLHGVNMVYKIPPYYPSAAGFGADDAAFLARIGFNAVRVGVIWKAVEPRPGVYDDAYLAHIAQTVSVLARHHIVALLDFHQDMYNELFQGEGFPDWSVQDDGLPPAPQRGFNQNYFVMPALQHAYDHFWENSPGPGGVGLQDRYAAAWRHVAGRFRADRDVLGYEVMNEPFPGTDWPCIAALTGCPTFDATLTAFTKLVDGAIRAVDPRTLVWYEPNVGFDFGPNTDLGPIGDPRAGFAFHSYCFEYDGGGGQASCATTADLTVQQALAHVAQTGDAVMMDEFGDGDYGLMRAMVARDDAHMVPWIEWAYCPCHDPTGAPVNNRLIDDPAKAPRGANLNVPGLNILVEPYPQVLSGTPLSWGFDPSSRVFSARWSTARAAGHGSFRAGAVSEIATPAWVYHRRYAAVASGGAVVSRPGAGTLLIAACRGARTVSVTVSPSFTRRQRGSCRTGARGRRRRR